MRHRLWGTGRFGGFARRVGVALGTAALAVSLTGGTAFAYHCYNASLSDQGREQMDNAAAFYTLRGVFTDLCGASDSEATDIVQALIDGYDGTLLNDYDESLWEVEISIAAHMAGGLEMWQSPNADQLWHDGKGIDHLGTDLDSFLTDLYYVAWEVASLDLDNCE